MNALVTIIRKELTDLLRDRRTVMLSLVTGPLLTVLMVQGMGAVMSQRASGVEEPITVEAIGADQAPNLVAFMQSQNITLTASKGDPEQRVRDQEVDLVLRVAPDYATRWRSSQPATVELFHDSSRTEAAVLAQRLAGVLSLYGQQVGAARLLARGVAPSVTNGVSISQHDLATPTSQANRALTFLPFMLMMIVFVGSIPSGVDNTAGERERQSLEPLLANPVSPSVVMSGKMLSTSLFTTLMLFVTLSLLEVGFQLSSSSASVTVATLGTIGLVLMPLVLVGAALISYLAGGAKSVKEAQSAAAGITMLPMSVMLLAMNPPKQALWVSATPLVSQSRFIEKLLRGEAPVAFEWVVMVAPTLAVAGGLWWLASRRYRDEAFIVST